MKTKLEHAVSLANRGFCIFPLSPNSKVPPAGMKWRDESTNHIPTIIKWWTENPDYNIGIDTGKSGLFVVDIDVKDGKKGAETFDALNAAHGFPDTLTAITASGGEHWIYATADHLGNTAGALGDGIDTRGWGGYIVAPGSTIDGKAYAFDDSGPMTPAPLPVWVIELLHEHRVKRQQNNRQDKFSEDSPSDIERYRRWLLETAELAVQGRNGDHTTFATAAKGREFGLSADTVLHMMLEHWNDRCSPPWGSEELQRKVDNAFKYANKAQGSASASADFEPVVEEVDHSAFAPKFTFGEEADIPLRDWIIPDIALAKNVTVIVASGGTGKSTLAMSLGLSLAAGMDFMNVGIKAPASVLIQNNEDDAMELRRRMHAIGKHHGVHNSNLLTNDATGDAANSRLMMQSGENRPFRIAQRTGAGIKPKDVEAIVAVIIAEKIRLLIVDPLSETHPANENDNGEMLEVIKLYREIAQRAGCAVVIIHHDRKPDSASADGHIGNMHSARGASSLSGVARVMFTLHTMTEKDAKRHGIKEEERKYYVRLDNAKANMSFSGGEPRWFKRIGERIGGHADDPDAGENVGVLAPVALVPKKSAEGSATRDMLNDIESLVIDFGEVGRAVSEIVRQLVSAFPAYVGKSEDALARAVKRMFDDGEPLPAAKGLLALYARDRQKGEPVSSPRTFIRWTEKPA